MVSRRAAALPRHSQRRRRETAEWGICLAQRAGGLGGAERSTFILTPRLSASPAVALSFRLRADFGGPAGGRAAREESGGFTQWGFASASCAPSQVT